jgi:hypothetical protein
MSENRRPWSRFGINWIDLLVIVAASLVFGATVLSRQQAEPAPPPERTVAAIASELGVTVDTLRHVAEQIPPPRRHLRPTEAQLTSHRHQLAEALNVPAERFDEVIRKYLPPRGYD